MVGLITIGRIFKQLLGSSILGPTKRKVNLAIKARYPLSDSGGVSAVATHISQRPRLTGRSYGENMMEQTFGSWIALLCEYGGHPYCHNIMGNCY